MSVSLVKPDFIPTHPTVEVTVPEPSVSLSLVIESVYEGGTKIQTIVETSVPLPAAGSDGRLDRDDAGYEDWEYDHIFSETGTGKEDGDACYFVTVACSSNETLIPVGTEFEFGL